MISIYKNNKRKNKLIITHVSVTKINHKKQLNICNPDIVLAYHIKQEYTFIMFSVYKSLDLWLSLAKNFSDCCLK